MPARVASKIDTRIAPPLATLVYEGEKDHVPDSSNRIRRVLERLAVRNLLRGCRSGISTGQAVVHELGITQLTRDELLVIPDPLSTGASPVDDAWWTAVP